MPDALLHIWVHRCHRLHRIDFKFCVICGWFPLKVEPRLKFYNTSGECALCPAEIRVIDGWREEAERRQIQIVKDVEEVRLNFEKRCFTEKRGQTSSLAKAHIDGKVFWTTERIATDARQ